MSGNQYFPLFVNLNGKHVLVVGAGKVGRRRACVLAEFGAEVTVLDPFADGEFLKEGETAGSVAFRKQSFRREDLGTADLVIAAASDGSVNDRVAHMCRELGIPVNHAGDQAQCDFFFPAIAETEGLVIGVSSSGKDHRKVRHFAAKLREWLKRMEKAGAW